MTFTTIRVPPLTFQGQEPYDIAVVKLEGDLKITARLKNEEGKELKLGAPVHFAGRDGDGICWFKVD